MSKIDFSIADRIDWAADARTVDPALGLAADRQDRAQLRALRKEEVSISRDFAGGQRWPYIAFALIGSAVWLSLFPLCMLRLLNPVIACALSTMLAAGGYLIAHEAIHGNLGRTGGRRFWLNDLVGWATLVPLVLPFSVGRLTHLSHHLHCNDPLLDPDYCDDAPGKRAALLTTFRNRQPAVQGINYLRTLERIGTPEAIAARRQSQIMQLAYLAILFTMAWSGHAIEAALIWWLPRQLALSYLRFTFSWAPHHPRGERRGRYRNTRVFRCWAGNLASMGMQYHIIHHLYPHILVHRHKPAFGAMRHVLEARGVDCSAFPLRPQPGRSAVLVA